MTEVQENCRQVLARIHDTAARRGRDPASIKLLAVTKTVPAEKIRQVADLGIRDIGENRLQEALPKMESLADLHLTWHFIGHLQTNKAKKAAEHFHWVQSVDREELAQKLHEAASRTLPVLIEVNLGGEATKSGAEEAAVPALVERCSRLQKLQVRGFMTIPPYFENPEDVRPYFKRLRGLADRFALPELSMGMSHDFEIAIEEGATIVRIGTALFGERP
jgi:pyridoxal phosphate enzyme (YggS family)